MTGTALVGTRKGLFEYSLDGASPTIKSTHFLGSPVTSVLCDRRDDTWYAGLDHGHFGVKLHRSDDHGATWTELGYPAYPADAVTSGEPATTRLLWTLEPGHAEQPDVLWCGTIPGGLFRSNDRGESWELNRPLWDDPARSEWFGGGYDQPGVHSISIDPRSPESMTVGVSCGGSWYTDDGGCSWTVSTGMRATYVPDGRSDDPRIQDPHRIVRCATAPDVLWTQHHNGIFRSTDNGRTWSMLRDVSPSAFGFAVAVHPSDPETAWFVPAHSDEVRIPVDGAMVVNRTRDGGQSFETIAAGLPQHDAYHLVYRHGLDVDATGQCLVMASTTGSLWHSDDGGTSFRHVTSSLPPVFCVQYLSE
jgi:BNR/Asp-box repeat